jgi:hypothetical protein
MSVKSKDFIAKARGIVGGVRPRSLGDFLDDDKQDDVRKAVETESRTDDVRKAEDRKTGREEFRFDANLIERLRRCAFETRRKKTAIVQEALDHYLKVQGF